MMVEQTLTIGIAMLLLVRLSRRRAQRCRGARAVISPWSFTFEPAFVVLAVGAGWLWLRAWRVERGTAAGLARRGVLARARARAPAR